MFSSRTTLEWRDDMPRNCTFEHLPPHVPAVKATRGRRRLLTTALLIPRLVAVSAHRR